MKKNSKGITLVALVITIITLLILSSVSIATLTNIGLFEKTKLAKQKSKNAEIKENSTLMDYENNINQTIVGNRDTITINKEEYEQLKNNFKYSEEEKIIGTWVNGKPLYRKVFLLSNPIAYPANAWSNMFDVSSYNIEKLINSSILCTQNISSLGVGYIQVLNTNLQIWPVAASMYTEGIILEYTKTIDTITQEQ